MGGGGFLCERQTELLQGLRVSLQSGGGGRGGHMETLGRPVPCTFQHILQESGGIKRKKKKKYRERKYRSQIHMK